jgi:hypothetical protein
MTGVRLIDSLATTGDLADLFSDRSVLQAMLDFDPVTAVLAQVLHRLRVVVRAAGAAWLPRPWVCMKKPA